MNTNYLKLFNAFCEKEQEGDYLKSLLSSEMFREGRDYSYIVTHKCDCNREQDLNPISWYREMGHYPELIMEILSKLEIKWVKFYSGYCYHC